MSHLNKNIISSEKDLHFFDDTATYDKGLNWYQQQLPLRSSADQVNTILPVFTARRRSLGQGNVFTPVCHSVHRGVGLPNPLPDTDPPRQTPWMQTSLGWTDPPPDADSARCRPPGLGRPPWGGADPPSMQTLPDADPRGLADQVPSRYCRQVGGTHPTGMHTCLSFLFHLNLFQDMLSCNTHP